MFRRISLVFLAAAVTAGALEIPDKAALLEISADVTADRYPDADTVILHNSADVRYNPDGSALTSYETAAKVMTEKGRRDRQTLNFHYTLPYGTTEVTRVERLLPDGSVIPVAIEEQSREMIDPGQMGQNIFNPDRKILRVGVPGLETGEILRYSFKRHTLRSRIPDSFSDLVLLEYTDPILEAVYRIHAPAELPLSKTALKSTVNGTVEYSETALGADTVHQWTARDVPQAFSEPGMPPLYNALQRVLVSTLPSWEAVSRWYWELVEPRLATTPEMEAKVAELTEGLDKADRLRAIFRFVSQDIRYMGLTLEDEAPGYEPHDAAMTFENRHGVCRDKAALLAALLRADGFEAFPVIIHVGPRKDEEVPQPFFNHAITAVRQADGQYKLMEPTDEHTRQLMPAYLSNKSYLVATPEGDPLRTSPPQRSSEHLLHIHTSGRVTSGGRLLAESELLFAGINDNAYRNMLSRRKPLERRTFFEQLIKRAVPGSSLVDFELFPAEIRDTSEPLAARISFEAPALPVGGGGEIILPLPRLGSNLGVVNFIMDRAGLAQRRFAFITEPPCGVDETIRLEVSEAVGEPLSLPAAEELKPGNIRWSTGMTYSNGVLEADYRFDIKAPEFSPGEYLDLKQYLQKIEYYRRRLPVFEPRRGDAADVEIMDEDVHWTLTEHGRGEYRRTKKLRILTYAGKKEHSELQLRFNPAWEEVELESAVVRTPDGRTRSPAPEAVNLMDAPWVADAPRYPEERIKVVSLPAVEVGAVIEYTVRRTFRDRPFVSFRESFAAFDPLRHKSVTVTAPVGSAPDVHLEHPQKITAVFEQADEKEIRRWETSEPMPALPPERNLPPPWTYRPTLLVSNGSWDEYAALLRQVLRQAAQPDETIRRKAGELVDGIEDRLERIRVIRDLVARRIRTAGPSFLDLPLEALTPAARVLADGYGHRADQAVLLHALLQAAGLQPEFLLAAPYPDVQKVIGPLQETPQRDLYRHPLVRVRPAADSDWIVLNDTNQYDQPGVTGHADAPVFFPADGARRRLTVPRRWETAKENRLEMEIKDDGTAFIARESLKKGTDYGKFHRLYAEMTPEKRRRHVEEEVADISHSAEIVGRLETDYRAYPGRRRLAVKDRHYAVRDGDLLYFRLPGELRGLLYAGEDSRRLPLYRRRPVRLRRQYKVAVPPEFEPAILPGRWRWDGPGGETLETDVKYRPEESLITVTATAQLPAAVISADDYGRILEAAGRLEHPANRMVLLRRRNASGDN